MLAIRKQLVSLKGGPKYIEKAVQLPNGEWALVVFELIERDGHIIAKALSYKLLGITETNNSDVLCLPCIKSPKEFTPVTIFSSEEIHSFLKDLSFVVSQPTRAPSL